MADALSRMFEGVRVEIPEMTCATLLESLPLVYSSLEEHQKEDPFCKDLWERIRTGQGGVDNFQIHKGLLCSRPKGTGRRRWVVPVSLRQMLLKYFHDMALSGHLGAWKTFQRIATNFWWPKMRAEIFAYVRRCDLCQRAKPAQDTRVGLHSATPTTRPMERLFVDFVGPLVRTRRGNIAILVILDGFSKFVKFCPVRKMSSQTAVDCLEREFFSAYGTPSSVVTDNARVFCGRQFKDLCFRWGIAHITTTPYYPQASLAERVNRNLKSALKIFHHEAQEMWDSDLPWLSMAFNTSTHESTKCTPDKLFLGREMRSPLDVRWDLSPENVVNSEDTNQFWTEAYRNLQLACKKVARRYNTTHKPHTYHVGDMVVYRLNLVSSKAQKVTAKLMLRWSKPMVIAKMVRPNVVQLANPDTGVIVRRAHVSRRNM